MRCTDAACVSLRETSQSPTSKSQEERPGNWKLGVGTWTYFFAVFAGFGASAFTAVATIELPSIR